MAENKELKTRVAELEAKMAKVPEEAEHAVHAKLAELNLGHGEAKKEYDKLRALFVDADVQTLAGKVSDCNDHLEGLKRDVGVLQA